MHLNTSNESLYEILYLIGNQSNSYNISVALSLQLLFKINLAAACWSLCSFLLEILVEILIMIGMLKATQFIDIRVSPKNVPLKANFQSAEFSERAES